jgi:DNA segregation ATPase FtsK/SpoIIIE, S-DNA-T family
MGKNTDDVVVHRINRTKSANTKKNNNTEKETPKIKFDKQFARNIKIISLFLLLIAVLVFFSLISYTPKDEAFLELKISDLLGLIKGNPAVIAKAELTNNWLGLIGAMMSNYLYNFTIGYSVVFAPIVMFFWAKDLFKLQRISEKVLKYTTLYLIFALLFSGLFGTLAKLSWLPEISKEFSGVVGYYISAVLTSIVGVTGGTIFLIILFGVTIFFGFNLSIDKIKDISDNTLNNEKFNLKKLFSKLAVPYYKLLEYTRRDSVGEDGKKEIIKNIDKNNNDNPDAILETELNTSPVVAKNINLKNERIQKISFDNPGVLEPARIIRSNMDNSHQEMFLNDEEASAIEQVTNNERPAFIGIRNPEYDYEQEPEIKDAIVDESNVEIENVVKPAINENSNLPATLTINFDKPIIEDSIAINEKPISPKNEDKPKELNIEFNQPIKSVYNEIEQLNEAELLNELKESTLLADIPAVPIAVSPLIGTMPTEKPNIEKPKLDIYLYDQVEEETVKKLPKSPISTMSLEEKITYKFPTIDLLNESDENHLINEEELKTNARILQEKLETFKIVIENLTITPGPVVTQYEFVPAPGIKISRIENLSDDIAMALKARGIRIIAPIPGKGTVGIEIPNQNPAMIQFSSIIKSAKFHSNNLKLPLALGKTINGEVFIADLAKMPHLLIAGSTGSGKSVGINTIIASLIYKMHPRNLKFVIIDPKKVELRQYEALESHFLALSPDINETIITDPQDAVIVLKALCAEMDKRYDILASASQRNIFDYNQRIREGKIKDTDDLLHREMPFIVVIIDELADLMLTASKEVETPIIRIAQLARAVGIHLVVATQRPSVDVITGIIKANFPARCSYLVASKIDSRTILDVMGAEQLLGNGDMLFLPGGSPKPMRIQNAFISTDEVEALCEFIGNQKGYTEPYYLPSLIEKPEELDAIDRDSRDPLFEEAAKLVIGQGTASVSMVQRRLKVGYARAGRIIDELEAAGIVSPFDGSKSRNVYLDSISELEAFL